jgi:hypothetical protein
MMPLLNWTTSEPVPAELAAYLPEALEASRISLIPAGPKGHGAAMKKLLTWLSQFGILALPAGDEEREEMMANIASSYQDALGDLPSDLLISAIDQTIKTHKFRNLPLPGDIREKVEVELSERKALSTKIKSADFFTRLRGQQAAPAVRPKRTEAEIAAASAAAAQAKAILDNATIKRVPVKAGDHRTPTADPYKAAYAFIKRTGDE